MLSSGVVAQLMWRPEFSQRNLIFLTEQIFDGPVDHIKNNQIITKYYNTNTDG